MQDAPPDEGRFIPAPSRTLRRSNTAFKTSSEHSATWALGNVDRDFRWLILEKNVQTQGEGVKLPLRWLDVRVSDLEVVYVIRSPKLIQELGL